MTVTVGRTKQLPGSLLYRQDLQQILKGSTMKMWRNLAGVVMVVGLCCAAATTAQAQQDEKTNATMQANASDASAMPIDQLVTKTVHEAWIASGRNEDKWFAMVQQLAALSAQNRGITLPDTQEAGSKFGEWIKKTARKDPDQLLYAVVDHAVQYVGKKQATTAEPATDKK
jgi:hypothetical protein